MNYITHYRSPFGGITLACDGEALTGLWFDGQKYFGRTLEKDYVERKLPILEETVSWLNQYFNGRDPGFYPKMNPHGTPFQKSVWDVLLSVPYGKIITYGQIAESIASQMNLERMSAQAVGGAVGRNPISLIIPCHRVIGADGSLTGYAGGLDRKLQLLQLEQAETDGFHLPKVR